MREQIMECQILQNKIDKLLHQKENLEIMLEDGLSSRKFNVDYEIYRDVQSQLKILKQTYEKDCVAFSTFISLWKKC
jgi:hypothetical protein